MLEIEVPGLVNEKVKDMCVDVYCCTRLTLLVFAIE